MYTRYQVIMSSEDGEYVVSEWQTEQSAIDAARRKSVGEGQRVFVRAYTGGF